MLKIPSLLIIPRSSLSFILTVAVLFSSQIVSAAEYIFSNENGTGWIKLVFGENGAADRIDKGPNGGTFETVFTGKFIRLVVPSLAWRPKVVGNLPVGICERGPGIGYVEFSTAEQHVIIDMEPGTRPLLRDLPKVIAPADEVPGKISAIMVKDGVGSDANAWDLVRSFTTDLSEEARKKPYVEDPSSDEFARLMSLNLSKPQISSVAILGPGGTGKTTDVAQYVSRIVWERGPKELKDYTFLQIDASALNAGTQWRGSSETRAAALVEIAKQAKVIFVVDEIHSLRGAGMHSASSSDIFDAFKPLMADGRLKIIGMSTEAEFNKAFGGDSALMRRWGIIKKVAPTGEKLNLILRGWMNKYFDSNLVSDEMLNRVVYYSDHFNAVGTQPAKTISVLEFVAATRKVDGFSGPVSLEEIQSAVRQMFNLHPDQFDAVKMRSRILNLNDFLDGHVVGQTLAKDSLVASVKRAYTGTAKANLPKGRKIIAGPPGLGKTEIVKSLALGLERPFVRILMTDFQNVHTGPDALKERIAEAVQNNTLPVILFDEMEKAPLEVQRVLLDILDDGKFSMSRSILPGSEAKVTLDIDMRNVLVYMASNAGQKYIESLRDPREYDEETMKRAMINDGLSDLLFDRMDGVVPAMYLSKSEFQKLVVLEIRKSLKTFKNNNSEHTVQIENLRDFIRGVTDKTWKY